MKFLLIMGFAFTSLLASKSTLAANCDSNCQLSLINSYFSALDRVSRKNSTINDIDSLLALTHDDVKYIHVEYEANFTKGLWRKAFIRNLERGAYQNSTNNEMRVVNTIFGKNHMAIEYSHGVIQPNGTWNPTEPLLVIFGFTNGKISLIKELW
jgi:hypothetical protein